MLQSLDVCIMPPTSARCSVLRLPTLVPIGHVTELLFLPRGSKFHIFSIGFKTTVPLAQPSFQA